jgi:hypothetical protein
LAELLRLVVESLSDGALAELEELLASVALDASELEELASAELELEESLLEESAALLASELVSLLVAASVELLLDELSSDWYWDMSTS